jgi:hypothetical protein
VSKSERLATLEIVVAISVAETMLRKINPSFFGINPHRILPSMTGASRPSPDEKGYQCLRPTKSLVTVMPRAILGLRLLRWRKCTVWAAHRRSSGSAVRLFIAAPISTLG